MPAEASRASADVVRDPSLASCSDGGGDRFVFGLLAREGTDEHQHAEHPDAVALVLPEEARVDERFDRRERTVARIAGVAAEHGFGRDEGERPREHRERLECGLRLSVEQPHAPLDRAPHGPLPFRQVARAADEQTQRGVEAREDLPRRHRARAGRGQLDRERHSVQSPDDARDVRCVLLRHPECGIDRHGAFDEQCHGARLRGILRRGVGLGQGQRAELECALGAHTQGRPAGDEQLKARQLGDQAHQVAGGIQQVLHVVDDQQHVAPGQGGDELGLDPLLTGFAHACSAGDRAQDAIGRGDRLQRGEGDFAPGGDHRLSDLDRESRLSDAARTHDRDDADPRSVEQVEQLLLLIGAADEPRERGGDAEPGRRLPRLGVRPRRVEPVGQERRDVGDDQVRQFGGSLETAVGAAVIAPDAVEQFGEAGVAIGGGMLDVDQMRQLGGEEVFVLEPRDLLVGCDPSVFLPVQTDEDVALREVCAVQRPGRVRPRPEFEHDRCEME